MNPNANKIILDLCGGTGAWSEPYRKAGYDVRLITLPHFDVIKTFTGRKMMVFPGRGHDMYIKYEDIYGILAAPTCTMFSRARTTAKTPRDFEGAMRLVQACLTIIWETQFRNPFALKFWALENPAGHLQRFLGKPPFRFHPYDFGDRHSKETFIWGNFNLPKKRPVELNEEEIIMSRNNTRKLPPIPEGYVRDRSMRAVQIRRSITPQGFAEAFFKANQ